MLNWMPDFITYASAFMISALATLYVLYTSLAHHTRPRCNAILRTVNVSIWGTWKARFSLSLQFRTSDGIQSCYWLHRLYPNSKPPFIWNLTVQVTCSGLCFWFSRWNIYEHRSKLKLYYILAKIFFLCLRKYGLICSSMVQGVENTGTNGTDCIVIQVSRIRCSLASFILIRLWCFRHRTRLFIVSILGGTHMESFSTLFTRLLCKSWCVVLKRLKGLFHNWTNYEQMVTCINLHGRCQLPYVLIIISM